MPVAFVGRAHSPMPCHLWPTLACLSQKSMKEKSRRLWRRNRHVWRLLRCETFSLVLVLGNEFGCVIQTWFTFLFWQEQRLKELSKRPSFATTDTSPVFTTSASISTAHAIDLFSTPSCSNGLAIQLFLTCSSVVLEINHIKLSLVLFSILSALKMESDLFDMQTNFQPGVQPGLSVATAWGGEIYHTRPLHARFCVYSSLVLTSSYSTLSPYACSDPFSSSEAVDDSIPNLNPFLTKLVVDGSHLPVMSSDGVSFSSRTSGHEIFGGKHKFLSSTHWKCFFISWSR